MLLKASGKSSHLMLTTRLWSRCCPPPPFLKFLLEYSCIGFPGGPEGKDSAGTAGDPGSIPGSGRLPWRRASQSTPIFLPGSHGQRSLAGYSLWGHKESDTTECSHNCSQPGSSAHGILQARILEWVARLSSRGSSWPRDGTHTSYKASSVLTGGFFNTSTTWEAIVYNSVSFYCTAKWISYTCVFSFCGFFPI